MNRLKTYDDAVAGPPDPLDGRTNDFDWETLWQSLGEAELDPIDYQRLSFALDRILRWIVVPHVRGAGKANASAAIGRRAIGLCWALNPELFEDSPSLRKLAKRMGTKVDNLSHHSARASKTFGLLNRAQSQSKRAYVSPASGAGHSGETAYLTHTGKESFIQGALGARTKQPTQSPPKSKKRIFHEKISPLARN